MFKPASLKFFLSILLWLFISMYSFGQAEKAEAGFHEIMQQSEVVGLSVAVVKHNVIIYTHSFGLKDVESNQPLTDDCLFRIASISKSFSATCIMQLARSQKISLNDDISELVGYRVRNPKYPETVITLRMVLSHRSGINDSQGYFTLDVINPGKKSRLDKML